MKEQKFMMDLDEDSSNDNPTLEQLMLREAVKHLTPKQTKLWEMYNYDRFTQKEIAAKLKITQQAVDYQISTIETFIRNWCDSNMTAYELLKERLEENDKGAL